MRRMVIIRREELAVAATIGTVLLVVVTVAMISVLGVFAFVLVKIPEDPPSMNVVYSRLPRQW